VISLQGLSGVYSRETEIASFNSFFLFFKALKLVFNIDQSLEIIEITQRTSSEKLRLKTYQKCSCYKGFDFEWNGKHIHLSHTVTIWLQSLPTAFCHTNTFLTTFRQCNNVESLQHLVKRSADLRTTLATLETHTSYSGNFRTPFIFGPTSELSSHLCFYVTLSFYD